MIPGEPIVDTADIKPEWVESRLKKHLNLPHGVGRQCDPRGTPREITWRAALHRRYSFTTGDRVHRQGKIRVRLSQVPGPVSRRPTNRSVGDVRTRSPGLAGTVGATRRGRKSDPGTERFASGEYPP